MHCHEAKKKKKNKILGKSIHFYFLRIAAQQKKRLVILLVHQHVRCFWRQTAGNGGPDDRHSERERKGRGGGGGGVCTVHRNTGQPNETEERNICRPVGRHSNTTTNQTTSKEIALVKILTYVGRGRRDANYCYDFLSARAL